MNKIGVHALTFIGDIENPSIEKCLSQVAKIGYDVMELPLLNPDALDTNFVSKAYEKFDLDCQSRLKGSVIPYLSSKSFQEIEILQVSKEELLKRHNEER